MVNNKTKAEHLIKLKGFAACFSKYITAGRLATAAGLFLLCSLLPLLWLAKYNAPFLDDFVFGNNTYHTYQASGSLWQTFLAACEVSKGYYTTWQGTYAACVLFALQPAIFGSQYYAFTTYIILAAWAVGTIVFCRALMVRLLHAKGAYAMLVAFVVLFISIHQMPDANQGLYWYNSAVFYMFFHGLSLLLLGVLVYCVTAKTTAARWLAYAGAVLLAFVTAGGNYASAIVAFGLFSLLMLVLFLQKHTMALPLLAPYMVYLAGFVVSMVAPGNGVRAQQTVQPGLVHSVVASFQYAFIYANEWAFLAVLLAIVALLPVFWRIAAGTGFRFRLPLLVTVACFCLVALCFFPHVYAQGVEGPGRYLNVVYCWQVLALVFCAGYWVGWLQSKLRAAVIGGKPLTNVVNGYIRRRALPLLMLFGVAFFTLHIAPGRLNKPFTYVQAISSLRSGEAASYGAQMQARLQVAQQSAGQPITVPPITVKPALLYFADGDITTDAEAWANLVFSYYYDLQAVEVDA